MNENRTTYTVRHEREPSDNYVTPTEIAKWAVDRCLQISARYCGEISPRKMEMLEPGCGDIAPFCEYAQTLGINSLGIDSREECKDSPDGPSEDGARIVAPVDFLDQACVDILTKKFDIIATNPPFKQGIEFILQSLGMLTPRGVAAFCMKLNFLGTQGRMGFFQSRPPAEVHILCKRPSFAHGGTDRGQEYAILFWNGTDVDKKIRAKYGRITRVYWQDNKSWMEGER